MVQGQYPLHPSQQAVFDLDFKQSVRVATTASLPANTRTTNTLDANANGALVAIDGITLVVGDRLLVKDEVTGANNGIYSVSSIGGVSSKWKFVRVADADSDSEVTPGQQVPVEDGTVSANLSYVLTTLGPITLNTTALVYALYSATPMGPAGGDLGGTYPNPTVNDGADTTAIHNNVAGEIVLITEKTAVVDNDEIIIEDSEAADVKKSVKVMNLPGGSKFLQYADFDISSNQNNLDPGDAIVYRLNCTSPADITGLNPTGGNGADCVAADFDGTGDHLELADNTDVSTGDVDFYFAGWVYADQIATDFQVFAKGEYTGSDDFEYRTFWSQVNGAFIFNVSADGTTEVIVINSSGPTIAAKTWYFIEQWHDSVANTINIQVNRGTVDSTAHAGGLNDSAERLLFGATYGTSPGVFGHMDGRLQSWVMYKTTLPSTAIRDFLYNGGLSARLESEFAAAEKVGRVAAWEMSEETGARADSEGSNTLTDGATVPAAVGHCANAKFRSMFFYNVGTATVTFKHQDALSNPIRRLLNENGGDITLGPDELVGFLFDVVTSRWRGDFEGDPSAIHDDIAAEIVAVNEKTVPVSNDEFLAEDSAASDVKISVKLGNIFAFTGDTGAGGAKGFVPAPAAGDRDANKTLGADGTWSNDQFASIVSPSIGANVNNYDPGDGQVARITATGATREITGLAPTGGNSKNTNGRVMTIVCVGSNDIKIMHENGSSTVANRFTNEGGSDITLSPNQIVQLFYDVTDSRWRVK